MWNDATITYKHNHPDSEVINQDITAVTAEDLLQAAKINANDVDVIIGGPPCQGFSISGKRMIDDPRNKLYKSFVEMVRDIQPKMFVMENVPGLYSMANGAIKEQIISDFGALGYIVNTQPLTASDYGVPQARKRVFLLELIQTKYTTQKSSCFRRLLMGTVKGYLHL